MTHPQVVSTAEWQAVREERLAREKELTRQRDALAAERRRLPMVRIDKDYVFEGPDGEAGMLDLFDGRRQVIVYRFFFEPGSRAGLSRAAGGAIYSSTIQATSRSLTCTPATPPWCWSPQLRRATSSGSSSAWGGRSPGSPLPTTSQSTSASLSTSASTSSCTKARRSFVPTSRVAARQRRLVPSGASST